MIRVSGLLFDLGSEAVALLPLPPSLLSSEELPFFVRFSFEDSSPLDLLSSGESCLLDRLRFLGDLKVCSSESLPEDSCLFLPSDAGFADVLGSCFDFSDESEDTVLVTDCGLILFWWCFAAGSLLLEPSSPGLERGVLLFETRGVLLPEFELELLPPDILNGGREMERIVQPPCESVVISSSLSLMLSLWPCDSKVDPPPSFSTRISSVSSEDLCGDFESPPLVDMGGKAGP